MKNRITRLALLLCVLGLLLCPVQGLAAENGSVTLSYLDGEEPLVGAGFDVCSVNKYYLGVYHPVIQCLVEYMVKYLYGQFFGKSLAECVAHRCKMWYLFQKAIP